MLSRCFFHITVTFSTCPVSFPHSVTCSALMTVTALILPQSQGNGSYKGLSNRMHCSWGSSNWVLFSVAFVRCIFGLAWRFAGRCWSCVLCRSSFQISWGSGSLRPLSAILRRWRYMGVSDRSRPLTGAGVRRLRSMVSLEVLRQFGRTRTRQCLLLR